LLGVGVRVGCAVGVLDGLTLGDGFTLGVAVGEVTVFVALVDGETPVPEEVLTEGLLPVDEPVGAGAAESPPPSTWNLTTRTATSAARTTSEAPRTTRLSTPGGGVGGAVASGGRTCRPAMDRGC
jgi:hypothetical protein